MLEFLLLQNTDESVAAPSVRQNLLTPQPIQVKMNIMPDTASDWLALALIVTLVLDRIRLWRCLRRRELELKEIWGLMSDVLRFMRKVTDPSSESESCPPGA